MAEAKTAMPASPAAAAEKFRRPIVGDAVWFFDQTRAVNYSRMGVGPYAAMVVALDIAGVSIKIFGPHAVFDAERVLHRSELGEDAGKKRWWEWPTRS